MTTTHENAAAEKATAAATGASATERFRADKAAATDTPPERVSLLARELLEAVYGIIRRHATPRPTPSTTPCSRPG